MSKRSGHLTYNYDRDKLTGRRKDEKSTASDAVKSNLFGV